MEGIFNIRSPEELFVKLRSDIENMRENPVDEHAAFNFFITAESLVDWYLPGRENKKNRENLREKSIILQIVSHIASRAKHFKVEAKHHSSVTESRRNGGWYAGNWFASDWYASKWFDRGGLYLELDGKAKEELGTIISSIDLAMQVLEFWENELGIEAGNDSII